MDFSGSNVDHCFNGAEERSSMDDGWIILVFSHVNNLKVCVDKMIVYFDRDISYCSFNFSKCLICHLELNVCWFQGHGSEQEPIGDCGHYVDARSGVAKRLVEAVSIYGAVDAWHSWVVLLG